MSDRAIRIAAHQAALELVLTSAGILISSWSIAKGVVSASARMLPGSDTKGNVIVMRRPLRDECEHWHSDMGDHDCLDVTRRAEDALRSAGYKVWRTSSVPNMVNFTVPSVSTAVAV